MLRQHFGHILPSHPLISIILLQLSLTTSATALNLPEVVEATTTTPGTKHYSTDDNLERPGTLSPSDYVTVDPDSIDFLNDTDPSDTTCDIPLPTFTYVLAIKGLSFALLLIVPTAIGAYFMLGKFKINREAFLPPGRVRGGGGPGAPQPRLAPAKAKAAPPSSTGKRPSGLFKRRGLSSGLAKARSSGMVVTKKRSSGAVGVVKKQGSTTATRRRSSGKGRR